MKLHFAYSCYLLSLSAIMVISNIALRNHALINHVGMGKRTREYATGTQNFTTHDNATHDSATHGIITPQEFVFFNAAELVNFEHKKKERARHLLEQLCGTRHCHHISCHDHPAVSIEASSFAKASAHRLAELEAVEGRTNVLRVITLDNHVYAHCRQQFGIPHVVYTNTLVKKIATKQLSEKNMSSKKRCMLSALEKLLE